MRPEQISVSKLPSLTSSFVQIFILSPVMTYLQKKKWWQLQANMLGTNNLKELQKKPPQTIIILTVNALCSNTN